MHVATNAALSTWQGSATCRPTEAAQRSPWKHSDRCYPGLKYLAMFVSFAHHCAHLYETPYVILLRILLPLVTPTSQKGQGSTTCTTRKSTVAVISPLLLLVWKPVRSCRHTCMERRRLHQSSRQGHFLPDPCHRALPHPTAEQPPPAGAMLSEHASHRTGSAAVGP